MIKRGGKLSIKIPTKDDLIGWLKKGIPPIISVKIGLAYGEVPSLKRRRLLDQHGLVVYGYNGKNFLIRDPHPEENAIKKLPDNLLIYSWYRAKAYTLLVYK